MAKIATVFGGSGFVGRYVTHRLAKSGWRVKVAVRRPNDAVFVRPYGTPGQVEPVLANIRYPDSIKQAIGNSTAVVNCVGILGEIGKQRFDSVHVEGAASIARVANSLGVSKLVHLSAIGASEASSSKYGQTKALGEKVVSTEFPNATILRPSVIFGNEDRFLNRFAAMARNSLVIPLVGASTRFQPVYVDDIANAAVKAISTTEYSGIYELGGPVILTFEEIINQILHVIRRRRLIVAMPFWMASITGTKLDIIQFITGGLFANRILTKDQVRQLTYDNIVSPDARTFKDFGIVPTPMEVIIGSYLYCYRPAGQYTAIHESAELLPPRNDIN